MNKCIIYAFNYNVYTLYLIAFLAFEKDIRLTLLKKLYYLLD